MFNGTFNVQTSNGLFQKGNFPSGAIGAYLDANISEQNNSAFGL
ncbi:hypothetical protein [Photorhabdus temperata]|uniref:Uncharacterized protein n=1 Tax=Photorhabdus temperata J3 TaxID=1389415 RepID=U7R1P9_PHOTE|nr:hypothetical protein [Photorhabdus temperata]ERT13470.1 hypothetical protein O185_08565 [Photorhabdus temperata J3]